jgi:hypothetical protein
MGGSSCSYCVALHGPYSRKLTETQCHLPARLELKGAKRLTRHIHIQRVRVHHFVEIRFIAKIGDLHILMYKFRMARLICLPNQLSPLWMLYCLPLHHVIAKQSTTQDWNWNDVKISLQELAVSKCSCSRPSHLGVLDFLGSGL